MRQLWRRLGAGFVVAVWAAVAAAQPSALAPALQRASADLLRVAPATSVLVASLPDGEVVWAREPDTKRILASNTKLFTTAAALDWLGPAYFWETPLLVRGEVVDGVLVGDLAVIGRGDPAFSGRFFGGDAFAVFAPWASRLRELGITRVDGEVQLVHGYFDDELVHPDWPRDQLDRWYEAPVDALSFSDNAVLARVWGGRPGGRATAELRPSLPVVAMANTARTTAELRQHAPVIGRAPASDTIDVRGRVWARGDVVEKWVSVPDPVAWFGAALREGLGRGGVLVQGPTRAVEALEGDGWREVVVHRTSILDILAVVNKRSQNLWAEYVLKTLGAGFCGRGSFRDGVMAVRQSLDRLGVSGSAYDLVDGSGMSRGNRATPRAVVALLQAMVRHPWGHELVASLAGSGELDSSLAERLREMPYRGNVMAKTGTLSGVITLSGYVKARSGRLYAFSILCNRAASGPTRAAQDRFLRALYDHG